MNKKLTFFAFFITATLFTACSNRVYNNEAFIRTNNLNDKTVAILPADVVITGNLPKNFSQEQKIKQELLESKYFQEMLYTEFLARSKSANKNKNNVNFLNPNQVNNSLKTNNILVANLKDKTFEDLAKTANADMVILVSIKKNRLVSDAAAIGLDVAENVLNSIFRSNPNNNVNNTNTATRTYDISLDITLADGATGTVISKFSTIKQITWQNNPETEIRRNFRVSTRKFAIKAN